MAFCATILVIPLTYYTIQVLDRYRLPTMWVAFGLAATGWATPLEWACRSLRFRRAQKFVLSSRA